MTIDYAELRDNTVYDLLQDQFGFAMTLRSSREPTIDPNTGAITTAATTVDTTIYGIFRFFSQDEITKALEVGQDILANDMQALVEAKTLNDLGIKPDTGMQVIAQGDTYNVVRVTPTQPGGVALMYRLQLRK